MFTRKLKQLEMRRSVFLFVVILIMATSTQLLAQEYPIRPINVLVGLGAGGTLDTSFRPLASSVEKIIGQPLAVSNNGAGGGVVALGIVSKEKPDGYNLGVIHSALFTTTPHIQALPFKLDAFDFIMTYGQVQSGLGVKADAPWKTLKELVEYAKKNPGKVTYVPGPISSYTHLAMEHVAKMEGIKWTAVPFASGGEGNAALLGGHVDAFSGSGFFPLVKAGKVRILATHTEQRMKSFPSVPTFKELGYGFINEEVFMVVAPKGVPMSIINKLDQAFRKGMEDSKFIQTFEMMEILPIYRNSSDTKKYVETTYPLVGKMIEEFNIPKAGEKK